MNESNGNHREHPSVDIEDETYEREPFEMGITATNEDSNFTASIKSNKTAKLNVENEALINEA